jgi:hypothetical protein
MTIKDLEILISDDDLLDMLIYARCILSDFGRQNNVPALQYERSRLYNTLQQIKKEIDNISPSYKTKCVYRRK